MSPLYRSPHLRTLSPPPLLSLSFTPLPSLTQGIQHTQSNILLYVIIIFIFSRKTGFSAPRNRPLRFCKGIQRTSCYSQYSVRNLCPSYSVTYIRIPFLPQLHICRNACSNLRSCFLQGHLWHVDRPAHHARLLHFAGSVNMR